MNKAIHHWLHRVPVATPLATAQAVATNLNTTLSQVPTSCTCACEATLTHKFATNNSQEMSCAKLLQNICSANRAVTSNSLRTKHWHEARTWAQLHRAAQAENNA